MRDDVYQLISQLKHVEEAKGISDDDKKQAEGLSKQLGDTVEYAPWWVRILSALCLGIGTMIGYQRIVTTLGERLGNVHLTPAQGASAELVSSRPDRHFRIYRASRQHHPYRDLRHRGYHGQFGRRIALRDAVAHCHRLACDASRYDLDRRRALLSARQSYLLRKSGRNQAGFPADTKSGYDRVWL